MTWIFISVSVVVVVPIIGMRRAIGWRRLLPEKKNFFCNFSHSPTSSSVERLQRAADRKLETRAETSWRT